MSVRVKRRLSRAVRAFDHATDRLCTRALRACMTPEERITALLPEGAPQGPPAHPLPASAGPPTSYCFMYEDTTVPPGMALEAWRRMRR